MEGKIKLQLTGKHLHEIIFETKKELEEYNKDYYIAETDYANSIFINILSWLEKEGKKHMGEDNCGECWTVYQSILDTWQERGEEGCKNKETYYQGLAHLLTFRTMKK